MSDMDCVVCGEPDCTWTCLRCDIARVGPRLRHLQVGHVDHDEPARLSQQNRSDLVKRLRAIGMGDDEIGVAKAVDTPIVVVAPPEPRPLNTTREEARRRKQRERAESRETDMAIKHTIAHDPVLARKLGWAE